jgi:hypothetical protein
MTLRRLTPAQFRVIALFWRDELDYAGIAGILHISIRTVRKHIEDVGQHLPGSGPSSWRVLRYAEDLLELGFDETGAQSEDSAA